MFDVFGNIGEGFICSGVGSAFTRLELVCGYDVFSSAVHEILELVRVGRMKYRLSREACPDVVQRVKTVEYPLVCVK